MACEGGLGHNNPLNVTGNFWPGFAGYFNNVGVATFDTIEHGIEACAENLMNGPQYAGIRQALINRDLVAFATDPGLGIWGTGNTCPRAQLGV
jgi:hypothetical protein